MKIIDELIDELTDKNNLLTDILIKTKVLAFKLKNKELSDWINSELNGYENSALPSYRILTCQVMGSISNGFQRAKNFPIPLIGLDEKMRKGIQTITLFQSISTLDEYVQKEDGGKMIMNIPPEMYGYLSKDLDNGFVIEYARREIDRIQVIQTLTSVRTKLLDFLLNINEEIGVEDNVKPLIQGDLKEKVASTFHSSVFGDNTTIIVGDHNTQTVSNITKGNFEALEKILSEKGVSNKDIEELQQVIDNDNPNEETKEFGNNVKGWISGMLTKTMDGSWEIGLGAAGSLLAEGIKLYYGWGG
jgi:hypothetical protein